MLQEAISKLYHQHKYRDCIQFAHDNNLTPNSNPRCLYIVAASYFALSEYTLCLEILEQLDSALSDSAKYLSMYGAVSRRLGNFQKSKVLFLKALDIDPKSLSIRNNYANLLIDLCEFEEASTILDDILLEKPDFQDAITNKNRLNFCISHVSAQPSHSTNDTPSIPSDFNPLKLAFSDDEVSKFGRIKNVSKTPAVSAVVSEISASTVSSNEQKVSTDQLRLVEMAIKEGNSELALQICDSLLTNSTPLATVLDFASDVFIQNKSFLYAELFSLHSSVLDSPSSKHLINLCSLTALGGQYHLSKAYLERLASLDPNNPNIPKLEQQLDKLKTKIVSKKASFSFLKLLNEKI